MRSITTIGLDLAKYVFQVHGADATGAVVIQRKPRRDEGPCQVDGVTAQRSVRRQRSRREFRGLAPRGEGLGSKLAVGVGRNEMAASGEGVGDSGVGSEEALGRTGRAKPLYFPVSSPDRDVRALRPIVLALGLDVRRGQAEFTSRSTIGPQPVRHQRLWRHALLRQQFAQQPQRSTLVPPALHQHVEDFALAVDGPPQVHRPAGDFHEHLVQVPSAARATSPAPQLPGDQRSETSDPDPDGLVSDHDAALGEQFLDVAQAQGEA